jgi:hypothetical protein
MQRLVGVLVLASCACVAAGCGGSALQAKARKIVGDPHATVVGTQNVQALSGAHLTVVVMKGGSQGLGCGYALPYPGGGTTQPAYRCPHSSDAFVLLNPTSYADGGELEITQAQVAAIAKARATSRRFRMFPDVIELTVRCTIPHASSSGGPLPGMCATTAIPFGGRVRCVAFSEGWQRTASGKLRTAGWVVTFSGDGHVQSIRAAAHPPQRWSGHEPNTCSAI